MWFKALTDKRDTLDLGLYMYCWATSEMTMASLRNGVFLHSF